MPISSHQRREICPEKRVSVGGKCANATLKLDTPTSFLWDMKISKKLALFPAQTYEIFKLQ